jgi:flagellar motor component MotA
MRGDKRMASYNSFEIRALVKCSKEERISCISIILEIMRIAAVVKKNGIEVLEEEAANVGNFYLKRGLLHVVDGTDPELLDEILHLSNIYSLKTGIGLLQDIIRLEGILAIQSGYGPRMIEERLISFLGEDVYEEANKRILAFYNNSNNG